MKGNLSYIWLRLQDPKDGHGNGSEFSGIVAVVVGADIKGVGGRGGDWAEVIVVVAIKATGITTTFAICLVKRCETITSQQQMDNMRPSRCCQAHDIEPTHVTRSIEPPFHIQVFMLESPRSEAK